MRSRGASFAFALSLALRAAAAEADEIAAADLRIAGSGLVVVETAVDTGIDIPTSIQTEFGGKRNDEAPFVPGLIAVADLSGPGVEIPIALETAPGHAFRIPGLGAEGVYTLANIRLMKEGRFVQPATPPAATITVSNVLKTSMKVRQLTADELRARGINLDGRHFDVYEYTFTVEIGPGEVVEVPYVVAIDPRTHQARPVVEATPYTLPPDRRKAPPRWGPPKIAAFEFVSESEMPFIPQPPLGSAPPRPRPSIPAAIVIPNDIAVLHQFFAVGLMVRNGAAQGSSITLDAITATIRVPPELRVTKTDPVISFGQAVPILSEDDQTILFAQAEGEAEWILEALRTGTLTIDFDLRATYRAPNQPDVPLRATPRTSILVHDPRFNLTFSHPDVVREGIEYSTFTFVSNLSPAIQSLRIASGIRPCAQGSLANVCAVEGTPESHDLTLGPGETEVIEYRLRPGITGHAFASAGSVEGTAISAAVELHVGVDRNGIPLSPATLLLPHYARYLDPAVVESQLELLGLGYSLATAPLNQTTAKFPRIIRPDVFERAADLARAGQRQFVGEPEEMALFGMNLALLGNEIELREWDDFRRVVDSGRSAQAAIADRLEQTAIGAPGDYGGFADRIAAANAHRDRFLAAVAHAPSGAARPFAVTLRGSTTGRTTGQVPGGEWTSDLPFADVADLDSRNGSTHGALAIAGRWTENVELIVTPSAAGPITVEIIHPGAAAATLLRSTISFTAPAGDPVVIALEPGQAQVEARTANGGVLAIAAPRPISPPPLAPIAARQDLHLDDAGHRVSVLFNRPIAADGELRSVFHGEVIANAGGLAIRRPRPVAGAAAQPDGRIVNLNFDHILSANASYEIRIGSLTDPLTSTPVSLGATIQPRIENDRSAGMIYGTVLRADNAPIDGAEVALSIFSSASLPYADSLQFDLTPPDGTFFFEFVEREPSRGYEGAYRLDAVDSAGKATSANGAVRLPGTVQFVNLVFLGRGTAEGFVRYEDGTKGAGVNVVVGSTMFNESKRAKADANGFYRVENLPVGPLTFSASDSAGRVVFAANEVRTAGAVVTQDLVIPLGDAPGSGTVRGVVIRSDTNEPVAGARVGVFSRGYAVGEAYTSTDGRFEFSSVPAGFVTLLAAEWSVSRTSAAQDFDLRPDATRELTMILTVRGAESLARVEGFVQGEDPLHPNDPAFYRRVPGALVRIEGLGTATTDVDGSFVFEGVPSSLAGRAIKAWDPSSGRAGSAALPSPLTAASSVAIFIPAKQAGIGTIRVRLLSAAGFPVDGFDVFVPGIPKTDLHRMGEGIYELRNVPVGRTEEIWAVARGGGYGRQHASGSARVAFDGQIAPLNLRLTGEGKVRVAVRSDIALITDVTIGYLVWGDGQQNLIHMSETRSTLDATGGAGFATFEGVPALGEFTIAASHSVHGKASAKGRLAFDGDLKTYTLQLNRLASLEGVVYAIDGRTPIPGASVRLVDGRQDRGETLTGLDGAFSFGNLSAGASVQAIASVTQDGIFRTGYANARTPADGGALENVGVVLRRRGSVEGRVVYAAYRVFDPQDPSKNVADDTPGDLSDNAAVPLARFWLRELGFPSRSFGSATAALTADAAGRFDLGNVFEGSLRASAWDPGNQELRGNWTGQLTEEGSQVVAIIGIGGGGVGSLEATVVDPNEGAAVLNAEVLLLRKASSAYAPFDFGSTDGAGKALFEQVPPGEYRVQAYSKAQGRSGASGPWAVVADERTDAAVRLEFIGAVSGTVIDPEKQGAGVAASHVTLDAFDYETRTTTGGDGEFLFEGVREGTFKLTARDPESNRRAETTRALTQDEGEMTGVLLALEPTETLHARVFLPADDGSDSGILAPAIDLDIKQRCTTARFIEFCDFYTSLQENPAVVSGMLRDGKYSIAIREIGGDERTIAFADRFPRGSAADPLRLVLPAFGSVRVEVIQGGQPAAGARVMAAEGGRQSVGYTDSTGTVLLSGLRLGRALSIQARSLDGRSGSASATITSQTTAVMARIELGSYAGVAGSVEAESGGPSIGTHVAASFTGGSLATVTNGEGRYEFHGLPTSATGVTVSLTYFGPDQQTVGAEQSTVLRNEHASTIVTLPAVRLDATPPQLIAITPPDGATEVPPDTVIQFVFTEPIKAAHVTSGRFKLIPADSSSPVAATFTYASQPDGSFLVTLVPPAAPVGQAFRLRSNTLYRVIVEGSVADTTGHALGTDRGASFITSDYAEPRVLRVDPPVHQPLQAATTFRFVFNEAMDPVPWAAGGSGSIRLFTINVPGGSVIGEMSGRWFADPAAPDTIVFGPDAAIEAESHYRVVLSGARDLQGNVAADQTFEWASFDTTPPHVMLPSPLQPGDPLTSGVEYTLVPELRNGSSSGTPATDIEHVEYFRITGDTETFLTRKSAAPFSFRFVAPDAPVEGAAIAFRAVARDRSLNESAPADLMLAVRRNEAPQNLVITLDPSSFYVAPRVTATASFTDEGTLVTVEVTLEGTKEDGAAWKQVKSKQVTRASMTSPWAATSIAFDVPPFAPGSSVTATARATDVRGLAASATVTAAVLVDTKAPAVAILEPAADAPPFDEGSGKTIPVRVTAVDEEVSVTSVAVSIEGGETVALTKGSGDVWSGAVPIPSIEGSEIVSRTLTIVARDPSKNEGQTTVVVRVKPLYDPNAPEVSWACPTAGALVPAGYSIRLRIRALGNGLGVVTNGVQKVEFFAGDSPTPISGGAVAGSADHYEGVFPIPGGLAAGTTLSAHAVVTNVAGLTNRADISFEIASGTVIASDTTIDGSNVASFQGTLIIAGGKTTISGAQQLGRVIVLDGAKIVPPAGGVLMLAATELIVGCGGAVDASGAGFASESAIGGEEPAIRGSGGSHLGEGGLDDAAGYYSAPGTTFGSVTRPAEAGGGGGFAGGGAGGGVIRIDAPRIELRGAIRANGNAGSSAGGGAGGSIRLTAGTIEGDGALEARGGSGPTAGGGGGAIAIEYGASSGSWTSSATGGSCCTKLERNGASGTIWMKGPASIFGDLTIDSGGAVSTRPTKLPSLGRETIAEATGRVAKLTEPGSVSEARVGDWVEVTTAAGLLRGRWQIESVANAARIADPQKGSVLTLDGTSYQGYLVHLGRTQLSRFGAASSYSDASHLIAGRVVNGAWQFDDNGKFVAFTPEPDDRVFAKFTTSGGSIRSVEPVLCDANGCPPIAGMKAAKLVRGRILPNVDGTARSNNAEFYLIGVVIADGPPSITLADAPGAPVAIQAGDSVRGLLQFDTVVLRGAKLEADFLRWTLLDSDAQSSFTGNNEPPSVDDDRISLVNGALGPSVVGQPGSISDPHAPLVAIVRNERTLVEYEGPVGADGSFLIAVAGAAGDAITVAARDAHPVYPLQSRRETAGQLSAAPADPARLDTAAWGVDADFRARTLAREGSMLAVGSYTADGNGGSNRLVLIDLSNPAAPVRRATLTGSGDLWDIATANGFAFVAAGRFWSVDLSAATPAPILATDVCGDEYAVALSGGYAFAAEAGCDGSNYINVYDISKPSAPRYVQRKSIGSYTPYAFRDLFALDTDWLIGISDYRPNGVGHDVIIIDRRDPNDLRKIAELEIENFDAFRGALDGDVLWIVSRTSSEVATIDLSNPAAPALIARAYAGVQPNGITVAGGYAIVASGASGLFAFDASDPTLATRAGTATVAGSAWDVTAVGGRLYVADDTGLSTIPVNLGPVIDTTRIRVEITPASVVVQGMQSSIMGGLSPTVDVTGPDGSATGSVGPDGSFSIAIPGRPGQQLTLAVRNGDERTASHLLHVPFAASIEVLSATPAQAGNDAKYRARRVATDGQFAVATTGGYYSIDDDGTGTALLFTLPNASATASIASKATSLGDLWEVEVVNGWAYMTGSVFGTWNLSSGGAVTKGDQDGCGTERGLAVAGSVAFTAKANCSDNGTIFTWDVSTPGSPRLTGTAVTGISGMYYRTLLVAGDGLLVGISPDKPGGTGRDVTIIDRSQPAALSRISFIDIPDFDAVDGFVDGSLLFLAGLDKGIAIVDLADPGAPRHLATIDTPGIARAVAVSAPNELVVADAGGPGLTFIDVADRTRPIILGSQPLVGNATDVRVIGNEILVATEHHVQIVRRP